MKLLVISFTALSFALLASCASSSSLKTADGPSKRGPGLNAQSLSLERPQSGTVAEPVTSEDTSSVPERFLNNPIYKTRLRKPASNGNHQSLHAFFQKRPVYPREMVNAGINGKVTIWLLVDGNGKVADAAIKTTTDKRFNEPSLEAARSMKFPPQKDAEGHPIGKVAILPLNFQVVVSSVTVLLTVEEDGNVSDVTIEKSTDPSLNSMVMAQARKIRMQPLPKGSGSHKARLKITIK